MMKFKYMKAAMLGMGLSLIPLNFAMASPINTNFFMNVVDEQSLIKQQEVDAYLFDDHKDEIAEKGIQITHTSPEKGFVEVGISPYTEENADYIYELLGTDMIKIVDAEAPVVYDDMMSITVVNEDEISQTPADGTLAATSELSDPNILDDVVTDDTTTDDVADAEIVKATGETKTTAEVETTSAEVETTAKEKESNSPIVMIGVIGVAIILTAGVIIYSRKK